ncbi:MAG: hypothetical protein K9H14_04230 [Actinomycetia bacterium]|nr:hypothetical protein [Actinomycetes bacterium]
MRRNKSCQEEMQQDRQVRDLEPEEDSAAEAAGEEWADQVLELRAIVFALIAGIKLNIRPGYPVLN